MSQENVEVVKKFSRLFQEGDREKWREYFDPDVIWDTSASDMPVAGVYRGHAGVESFFRDWLGRSRRAVGVKSRESSANQWVESRARYVPRIYPRIVESLGVHLAQAGAGPWARPGGPAV